MLEAANSTLTFRIGHAWYGVSVDSVIEVIHLVGLTDLPGTSPDILGLLTLRDTIMPVVDMRLRLGYPAAALRLDTPIIALWTAQGSLGMVVDDVDDVVIIREVSDYENADSPYVNAVARLDERLLLLLDTAYLRAQIKVHDSAATL